MPIQSWVVFHNLIPTYPYQMVINPTHQILSPNYDFQIDTRTGGLFSSEDRTKICSSELLSWGGGDRRVSMMRDHQSSSPESLSHILALGATGPKVFNWLLKWLPYNKSPSSEVILLKLGDTSMTIVIWLI